jgi:hypothetical protein
MHTSYPFDCTRRDVNCQFESCCYPLSVRCQTGCTANARTWRRPLVALIKFGNAGPAAARTWLAYTSWNCLATPQSACASAQRAVNCVRGKAPAPLRGDVLPAVQLQWPAPALRTSRAALLNEALDADATHPQQLDWRWNGGVVGRVDVVAQACQGGGCIEADATA